MSRFNILAIAQEGRLGYEALLLAASLRRSSPGFQCRLFLAEPQPSKKWPGGAAIQNQGLRAALLALGAEFLPFENKHFGKPYPYGNKIEALTALPDEPFLFLDTDTLITGDIAALPFDFTRPSASMRREGTWPQVQLYKGGYEDIWGALYARFGLDFAASQDKSHPVEYWQRYLYFNAGWFFGASPQAFGRIFLDCALSISDNPPPELAAQELYPWLDQIALPLVIHALGGGRPGPELAGLDGDVTCHYRLLPLLYARESDLVVQVLEEVAEAKEIRRVLRDWEAAKMMIYQNRGAKARALFDRADLPRREQAIRGRLKEAELWIR